jgi:hypothetical protein
VKKKVPNKSGLRERKENGEIEPLQIKTKEKKIKLPYIKNLSSTAPLILELRGPKDTIWRCLSITYLYVI